MGDSELPKRAGIGPLAYAWFAIKAIFAQTTSCIISKIVANIFTEMFFNWQIAPLLIPLILIAWFVATMWGTIVVRMYPGRPEQGVKWLRPALIGTFLATWYLVKAPFLGWSISFALGATLWATFVYKTRVFSVRAK